MFWSFNDHVRFQFRGIIPRFTESMLDLVPKVITNRFFGLVSQKIPDMQCPESAAATLLTKILPVSSSHSFLFGVDVRVGGLDDGLDIKLSSLLPLSSTIHSPISFLRISQTLTENCPWKSS